MAHPTPIIPALVPQRLRQVGRIVAAMIGLGALTVLSLAAWMEPARGGMGTHEQIGLPPCAFVGRTSLPCGTCGMTTSFAHFANGNLLASFYLQPFAAVLATATAMTVWVGGYCAVTGKPAYRLLRRLRLEPVLVFILVFWLLAWGWKIWLVVSGRDGW